MRVKSRRIYTVLNGGCYFTQPGDKARSRRGDADARFSNHWMGTDPAVLRRDDRQPSRRGQPLRSAARTQTGQILEPVFAGRRVATQGWAIFGVGNLRLYPPCVLELFVDTARFLDRPVHNHCTAQRGERPFHQRRKQERRHTRLRSENRQRNSFAKAAFSGRIVFCASMPQANTAITLNYWDLR